MFRAELFIGGLMLVAASFASSAFADDELGSPTPPMRAPTIKPAEALHAGEPAYPVAKPTKGDRLSFQVTRGNRGTSVPISENDVIKLCSDIDGCTIRLGMYNWDNSGRVASRESLFFYNSVSHTWRASSGDVAGTNYNGITEHILQAWSCYFTDGAYKNWADAGDSSLDFGLLSWNQYNADCWLTIID